ncbi:MAG: tRNA epoxyqueuosine(34) reductase QueG, partial [Acidobacteriota bacterium]
MSSEGVSGARIKQSIRSQGLALGFSKVGFAKARLTREARNLERWIARGHHGEMHWMAREPSRRTDAGRSLPGTLTVVCCALNYYQGPPESPSSGKGVLSAYARGEDYHLVLGDKLRALARYIESRHGLPSKLYVDTGPLLEKGYAVAAGLGWLGKHSNVIARDGSSWFFLGEILLPVELDPDRVEPDHCGTCSRCVTACPTGAIVQPYVVDSRLCISYLTIELKGFIPRELRPVMGQRIFGCDDCQDACPWNRFARKSEEAAFFPKEPLASMDL